MSLAKLFYLQVALVLCFTPIVQAEQLYNWKQTAQPLYQLPNTKSPKLLAIPKNGAVQLLGYADVALSAKFSVCIGYYGCTVAPATGDNANGTYYLLQSKWLKVMYKGKAGYVQEVFFSRYKKPEQQNFHYSETDEKNTVKQLVLLFGIITSKSKKELPKQFENEEHYEKKYRFKNGNYYNIQAQYTGEGIGGETHEIFLKGAKKHEAILLLLALYTSDNYKIEDKQPASPTIYDRFRWYYQNQLSEADKKEMDLDLYFSYYSEGTSSDIQLKETAEGIVIRFGFGGC